MATKYPLSKENFTLLEITDLIINIKSYDERLKDPRPINRLLIEQYKKWCIECLHDAWTKGSDRGQLVPLSEFLSKLLNGSYDSFLHHISEATKNNIYVLILKEYNFRDDGWEN